MMYRVFYIVILIVVVGCKKERMVEDSKKELLPRYKDFINNYVKSPNKNDVMCRNDIEKAKNDLIKYKKIYVTTSCFGCDFPIYSEELSEFSIQNNVKVVNNDLSCIVIDGQTAGCYTAYIDGEMFKKFGENFRNEIENGADKLLVEKIKRGKVVNVYDLNDSDKPHLPNETNELKEGYTPFLISGLSLKISHNNYPFMDISFVVEKDGSISNLRKNNWVSNGDENEKFSNELENKAIKMIMKNYSKWTPGKYKNNVARVENNFRVKFR